MNTTVIIPTFGRPESLAGCIGSIAAQSLPPHSVVVVDDTPSDIVEVVCRKLNKRYPGLNLIYMRNPGSASITLARNEGLKHASTEWVTFLDDDVILDNDYFWHLAQFIDKSPDAVGIQGHIRSLDRHPFEEAVKWVLGIGYVSKRKARVRRTFETVYPARPGDSIPVDWLSGCNMSFRTRELEGLNFEHRFRRYCYMEDVDFSLQVQNRSPGKLWLVPVARLQHHHASTGRLPAQAAITMRAAHQWYLASKHKKQGFSHAGVLYGWVGRLLATLAWGPSRFASTRLHITAYVQTLRHRKEISRGNLDSLLPLFT